MKNLIKKRFAFNVISLCVISQVSLATEFVNYTGPVRNPIRTVEETLFLQKEYKNKKIGLDKDNYRYPPNSYYSVSYLADIGVPSESIIGLNNYHSNNDIPKKLNIDEKNFILDKAFPESSVINLDSSEVKYQNGKVTVGTNTKIDDGEFYNINVFELHHKSKLSLKNIEVDANQSDTPLTIAMLYKSELDIDKVDASVRNNQSQILFDLEESTLTAEKLSINSIGNGEFLNVAFISNNSKATLKDSNITLDSSKKSSAVFGLNETNLTLKNSRVYAKNNTIAFSNLFDIYADKNNGQNVINIKDYSLIRSDKWLVNLNGDLASNDIGEGESFSTSKENIFNVDNSILIGNTYKNKSEVDTKLIFNLSNKSKWTIIDNSQLDQLNIQNSEIIFERNGFHTLTLDDLRGSGTFTLNTDLANQQSDQIIINGLAEGSHKLDVKDSGNEPQAANGKVTLVKTSGNGEAQFSLLNRDYVDAGAYRYRLAKEQNDWVLSNKQAEPTKPVEPTKPAETAKPVAPAKPAETIKPVEPTKPTENAKPAEPVKPAETAKPTETAKPEATQTSSNKVMLSGTSNALASLRQAQLLQLEQGLVGIHQRLGEQEQVGNLGVWVRNINNRSEFASTSTTSNSNTSGFEQDSHQIQVGVETALSNNWRVGGFVENSRSKIDFNGEYGSGKVKGQGVGLILTYQGNGGFYLDNIAKYSRLKATSDYTNSQRYHAYSLSSEIGKAFELGKFTLTPNAQLAWHSLSGKVNEDRLSSLYARVGARLATTFDMASWKLQPYFEINGISSKNRSSQVRVNQYAFDVASSRGRVENALGLNIAKGQHRFGVEAKTAYGKRLDQPFVLQAVYRYQW